MDKQIAQAVLEHHRFLPSDELTEMLVGCNTLVTLDTIETMYNENGQEIIVTNGIYIFNI